ncbi:MAG: hypothetical protein MK212_14535 [Saprospiraceae bacterium]|nr:hypothetical protein [Saprospiraceae bacterium]
MAKYIIILLVATLSFSVNAESLSSETNNIVLKDKAPNSTHNFIVMEEDILRVTVDTDDEISKVYIYQTYELVGTESGCGSHQCEYNLSQLPHGIYQIVVITKNQNQYSAQVML